MGEEMQIQFVVEESLIPDVRPAVEAEGGTIVDEKPAESETEDRLTGLEPVIVLSVAMAAGALIRILSDTLLDHKHPGGLFIDTRTTPMTIERDDSLDRGTIIVVTEDGLETFFPDEREDALDLLKETLGTDVRLP